MFGAGKFARLVGILFAACAAMLADSAVERDLIAAKDERESARMEPAAISPRAVPALRVPRASG